MSKYVFLFLPAWGHVTPSLSIAAELLSRGEEVVYYLTDEFAETVKAIGATFRNYDENDKYKVFRLKTQSASPIIKLNISHAAQSLYVLPQVLERILAEQADCIVYDGMCLWAQMIISHLGVPAVTIRTSFAVNMYHNVYRRLVLDQNEQHADIRGRDRDDLRYLYSLQRQLSQTYGVKISGVWNIFTHAGPCNIVLMPSFFHPAAETFGERFIFVGPSFIGSRSFSPPDLLGFPLDKLTNQKIVYISLGTTGFNERVDFYHTCFAAFKNSPYTVVLSYGSHTNDLCLSNIPENFIVFPYVPQLEILARSSIFISHGGLGSTMESLYHRVPLVILPMAEEHAIIANIIRSRNLGISLDMNTVTADQLRTAVDQIIENGEYHEALKNAQIMLKASSGYKQAADIIMNYKIYQP